MEIKLLARDGYGEHSVLFGDVVLTVHADSEKHAFHRLSLAGSSATTHYMGVTFFKFHLESIYIGIVLGFIAHISMQYIF